VEFVSAIPGSGFNAGQPVNGKGNMTTHALLCDLTRYLFTRLYNGLMTASLAQQMGRA